MLSKFNFNRQLIFLAWELLQHLSEEPQGSGIQFENNGLYILATRLCRNEGHYNNNCLRSMMPTNVMKIEK
jgi:hypothetical protein